jgi:hypothetical protein
MAVRSIAVEGGFVIGTARYVSDRQGGAEQLIAVQVRLVSAYRGKANYCGRGQIVPDEAGRCRVRRGSTTHGGLRQAVYGTAMLGKLLRSRTGEVRLRLAVRFIAVIAKSGWVRGRRVIHRGLREIRRCPAGTGGAGHGDALRLRRDLYCRGRVRRGNSSRSLHYRVRFDIVGLVTAGLGKSLRS